MPIPAAGRDQVNNAVVSPLRKLATHASVSASLPTEHEKGDQSERSEQRQFKTEDSTSIFLALSVDHSRWPAGRRTSQTSDWDYYHQENLRCVNGGCSSWIPHEKIYMGIHAQRKAEGR